MSSCSLVNLGLIAWADAYALQERAVAARKAGAIGDVLLLCEHPHTITLGRNGKQQHLLASPAVLRQKGVAFHHANRGGDVTYHGPGQLVGYPILNLAAIRRDIGWYMRMLEEAMIRASADFGVTALREAGKTGIWVSGAPHAVTNAAPPAPPRATIDAPPEKLAALGVHLSRWITSHGFAYNVSTDLRYFDLLVPCGIADRKATSLEKLLDNTIAVCEVAAPLAKHLGAVLNLEMQPFPRVQFLEALRQAEGNARTAAPNPMPTMAPTMAPAMTPATAPALEPVRSDA